MKIAVYKFLKKKILYMK